MNAKTEARWRVLLARFGVPWTIADSTFSDVARRYEADDRVYHTLAHVQDVLDVVVRLEGHTTTPEPVQLAAWLHDVVYDSRATDNEERSAVYAGRLLQTLELPPETILEVQRLIRLTKTHVATADDGNAHVLLDADLAILGASPAAYDAYARAIRREYAWAPQERYRQGRSQVLKRFLEREHIYYTPSMRGERESPARDNLRRELASLSEESWDQPED